MTIEEIREAHKKLHWSSRVQKQVLIERLEDWRTVEETINKWGNKWPKYILEPFWKWKRTTKQ